MRIRPDRVAGFGVVLALLASAPIAAQAQSDASAVEKLLQILVKNGVVTRDQADGLARQARDEARAAHAGNAAAPAGTPVAATKEKPIAPGTVRVTYVPETVRKQIAAEVKQQVMQQATEEGWAEPNSIVEWTQRIKITGDVRVRGQSDLFPSGNFNAFPDFNAINGASNGFDSTSGVNPPLLNTTENRTRARLRARLGVEAKVTDWVEADIRIATGNDRSPVSTNQTLGAQGDFSKTPIWLDQAAIIMRPDPRLTVSVGRFANPFWTTNLSYDNDLNFDGLAASGHIPITDHLAANIVAGGFPVFNTAFALGSTNLTKTASHDAYLLAAQAGAEWKPQPQWSGRLAVGYFAYQNVQGLTSSLCASHTSYGSCDTDVTSAPFVQFGNSVFPVRNISAVNGTSTAEPQLYGLASGFNVLNVHGQTTYSGFHPIDVRPEFEYVRNLAFNQNTINSRGPVNNLGVNNAFVGSGDGYLLRVSLGHLDLVEANDWNLALTYKYVGSDAVLDALTDSNFHDGGTNAKGFILGGNYALGHNVWLTGTYMSSTAVSGPPFAVDTLQADLNVKF
jgi:hypothetical protein